jgi:hypothetical protein
MIFSDPKVNYFRFIPNILFDTGLLYRKYYPKYLIKELKKALNKLYLT